MIQFMHFNLFIRYSVMWINSKFAEVDIKVTCTGGKKNSLEIEDASHHNYLIPNDQHWRKHAKLFFFFSDR